MKVVVTKKDKRIFKKLLTFITLEIFLIAQTPFFINSNNNIKNKDKFRQNIIQYKIQKNKIQTSKDKKITNSTKIVKNELKYKDNKIKKNIYKEIVHPSESKIIKYNNVILEIPDGAVTEPIYIVIEELKEINNLDPGMYNVTSRAIGYRFKPDGMKFKKDIKVTLPFDKNKISNEYELNNLYTYFYDEKNKIWEKLERISVNYENYSITSKTNHFTDLINSTLKLPENPKPMSFNINSIKDIKAANPFSNIPEIQGLEANPYGAATFSIPLTIPHGRKGLTPKLSLDYNSQGGNGWLGVGFNIDVQTIEIDTKFGVPNYDGNDPLTLNGKKIYPVKNLTSDKQYRYYTTEGVYERIIRKGTCGNNYYFEVTKPDGTKYIYGNTADSRLQSNRAGSVHIPQLAFNNPIYKWFLKQIIDTNGNYITYVYNTSSINSSPKEIYLSEIRYTGHGSDTGKYLIRFNSNNREDVILDCRGKFQYRIQQRLTDIDILYDNTSVRKYILNYKYNAFRKSQLISLTEQYNNNDNFYTYNFDYYTMPLAVPNNYSRLAGFQSTIQWDNTGASSLSKSYSLSIGGSLKIVLGLGLGFDGLLGVGGGVSYNKEFTNELLSLIDLNGDGLADYLSPPSNIGGAFGFFNNNLEYRLNTISGFDDTEILSTSGTNFAGFINATQQDDLSFFANASAGVGVSGNYTNSRSVTHTTVTDINGDGLPDFIMSPGATSYFRGNLNYWLGNSVYAYEEIELGTTDTSGFDTGIATSGSMKNTLHLLDPTLKWKSYHKGKIKITGKIKKTGEDGDGIKVNFYKDNINSNFNYLNSTSLFTNNPLMDGTTDLVDIIIDNFVENTSDSLNFSDAEIEARKSNFIFDTDKTIIIDMTVDIDRFESIYLKINSIKSTIGDIAESNLEIIYRKIGLHDFMKEYDNVYIPDDISNNEYDDLNFSHSYEDVLIKRYYINETADIDTINTEDRNGLIDVLGRNGYLIPKKIKYSPNQNAKLNALEDYYKINNNGTYFVLDESTVTDDNSKEDCYEEVKDLNLPSSEVYYRYRTYNENVEYDNQYYIDREIATNVYNNARVYQHNSAPNNIGVITNEGVLVDNNIWIEKINSNNFRLDKGSQTINGGYRNNYTSEEDIFLIDSSNSDYDIVYIIYNNKTTLPCRVDANLLNATLSQYYNALGYLRNEYDNTTDDVKISASNDIAINTSIIDYDILVKTFRIYEDRVYTVYSTNNSNNVNEDIVVKWADFNNYSENTNNINKSYIQVEDFSGRNITNNNYYIHVFNADKDLGLENLRVKDETFDEDFMMTTEPQEYFSGGRYNWFYGEWNGNFLWDINKIVTEVNAGKDDTKSFRYFVPMAPLDTSGNQDNTADINYWNKNIWHGTTTHYTEKSFDDNGDVQTENFHETSYISKFNETNEIADSVEFCSSKKGAGAGSGLTGAIATTGLGGLQESVSESFNFGFDTPWGLGININDGTSRSSRDFIDMNGDRYPDQVIFDNSNNCNVIFNENGEGFTADPIIYENSHDNLRYNKSYTVGFGLGQGSSIRERVSAYLDAIENGAYPNKASYSVSLSASLGHSLSHVDLIDINGDGLPDHVRKTPGGGYDVQLNLGDTFVDYSWTSTDWISSISGITYDSTNDDINNLIGDLNYLQYNNTISTGINVGFGYGHVQAGVGANIFGSRTKAQLIDINGDGLPDQVVKLHSDNFFRVKLNLGNRFSPNTIRWYSPSWEIDGDGFLIDNYILNVINNIIGSSSTDDAIGDGDVPITPNVDNSELTFSESETNSFITDTLKGGSNLLNDINPFGAGDVISYGGGIGFSVSFSIKIEIPIIPLFLSLYIIPGLNFGYSFNSGQLQLRDIDGDGLADHVFRYDLEGFSRVKLNNAKQVGLLREITTPTGGKITLEYEREGNTANLPDCTYVLSNVTKTDGFNGGDSYEVEYEYENGFYDRYKRSNCGFEVITQHNPDGTLVENYYNNDYYEKGIIQKTILRTDPDDENTKIIETIHDYDFVNLDTDYNKPVKFAQLDGTQTIYYDLNNDNTIIKEINYLYDDYGNIYSARDLGNASNSNAFINDDININIEYQINTDDNDFDSDYIVSNPDSLFVTDNSNNILRQRTGTYDTNGNLTSLTQYINNSTGFTYNFDYNGYGNIIEMSDPLGYSIEYFYDTSVYSYITSITDTVYNPETNTTVSYSSSAAYDYGLGLELSSTDINGNSISKNYDVKGRLLSVRTDNDTGSTPAVSFDYTNYLPILDVDGFIIEPGRALTKNKVHYDAANINTLDTILYVDGLQRIKQTKKEGEIYNNGNPLYGMNVSGVTEYDEMGRVYREYQPDFQSTGNLELYYANQLTEYPTEYTYDLLGRISDITLPDGNIVHNDYSITNTGLLRTSVIDPQDNVKISTADIRENILSVEQTNVSNTFSKITNYEYNLLGEITGIIDAGGNTSSITYDALGRMTSLNNPDIGLYEYFYDAGGNLIKKLDGNLRDIPGQEGIQYVYDTASRLIKVIYPGKYINTDTVYTYGGPGGLENTAGRIAGISDESGTTYFEYGILGETTSVQKNLNLLDNPNNTNSYTINYLFDYLGRMEEIQYPDGETVSYEYDEGGKVNHVYGEVSNVQFEYVSNIGYDKFGQRVFIQYGNGITTNYTYNPERRWLTSIRTGINNEIQNLTYQFDDVGNINNITNTTPLKTVSQTFTYDDLYQLTGASGTYTDSKITGFDRINNYTQNFVYDNIGNITSKVSTNIITPGGSRPKKLNYSFVYNYDTDHPHRAIRIADWEYTYDLNGNLIERTFIDETQNNTQNYDDGDLGIPNTNNQENNNTEDEPVAFGWHERDINDDDASETDQFFWDEENRLRESIVNSRQTHYLYNSNGERTVKEGSYGETVYVDKIYQEQTTGNQTITKHIFLGETRIASKISLGGNDIAFQQTNTYFYHPDHLGSSNYITEHDGDVFEHILYTPYGETWVQEENDYLKYIEYKFSSKELDEETNLYYFGARYLDPVASRWMSCDPALKEYLPKAGNNNNNNTSTIDYFNFEYINSGLDRYSNLPGQGGVFSPINLSLYHYSGNNPIIYVDPDGRSKNKNEYIIEKDYGTHKKHWTAGTSKKGRISEDAANKKIQQGVPLVDSTRIQDHHVIPYDNKKYPHYKHGLLKQAKMGKNDLKKYSKNLIKVGNHSGTHIDDYNEFVNNILDINYLSVAGKGQKAAIQAIDKSINQIINAIKNKKVKLYHPPTAVYIIP